MENKIPVTSQSIGLLIGSILGKDELLKTLGIDTPWPVHVNDRKAKFPLVIYNRDGNRQEPNKTGLGSDSVIIGVSCCAKSYKQSVEIGEAVRAALLGNDKSMETSDGVLYAKQILLADTEEFWDEDLDCYCQRLTFTCKAWGTSQG